MFLSSTPAKVIPFWGQTVRFYNDVVLKNPAGSGMDFRPLIFAAVTYAAIGYGVFKLIKGAK